MAEKKKGKRRKEEYIGSGDNVVIKPPKEEYAVANWMRKNVPIKKTKFLNHNVQYFTGSKAVDALLDSPWTKGDESLFKTREAITGYLHVMLEHKFFHRARKVPVTEQELKLRKGKEKKVVAEKKTEKVEEVHKETKEKVTDAESSVAEVKKDEGSVEKDKRKRKVRLDMHNDQRFVDSLDAYVWIYDPIPFYYWIIGTLLVLGAIGVCLFPLWPPAVRLLVYYLSVAAAGFLVVIIALVILRLVIFCLVWLTTLGKHHIWILPNLTEDVGFFASFWPLYMYEYKGNIRHHHKDKCSDAEDDAQSDGLESEKLLPSRAEKDTFKESSKDSDRQATHPPNGSHVEEVGASESESESSQRSSTGKDFEMVYQGDIEC